jgi:hypothetical protein
MNRDVLDLRDECLESTTAYDVAVVGSMMLWPADEKLRKQVIHAVMVDLVFQSGNHPHPETAAERREFIELIRTAPRASNHDADFRDGYTRGMIAGEVLKEIVFGAELPAGDFTLTAIKKRIASRFIQERISVSTINNSIWRDYRRVAAYWAAFITIGMPTTFPCRPAILGVFLSLADDFRRRAETIHTPQSPKKTLLREGETVAIPSSIHLPPVRQHFAAFREIS